MNKIISKKFCVAITAIFIAAVMMSVCLLCSAGASSANAEVSEEQPKTLYYISDYNGSDKIAQSLTDEFGAENVKYQYFQAPTAEYFLQRLIDENWLDVFFAKGAYVIIEVRKRFLPAVASSEVFTTFAPNSLKEIFVRLKRNECRTIFINGTDESQFVGYNDLFDYVDFQINTDLYFTFEENIMYRVAVAYDSARIADCTFLFDDGVVVGNNIVNKRTCSFITNYFMIYMKKVYEQELFYEKVFNTVGEIMTVKNIFTLAQVFGTYYADLNTEKLIDIKFAEDHFELTQNPILQAVGNNTYQTSDEATDWITEILECFQALGRILPDDTKRNSVYVYDGANYKLSDYFRSEVLYARGVDDADVIAALIEFIQNDDAGGYNNWSGKSGATFKPLRFGEGGWMRDLHGGGGNEDLVVDLPLFFDTAEIYNYYYGTSNNW